LAYILLGDLRDVLEEAKVDPQAWKWVESVIEALLEIMPREFELLENGGYLEEVLSEHPNWHGQVQNLFHERCDLYGKLYELRLRMEESRPLRKIAGDLQHDLRDWMNSYIAHQRHERRIVQNAFNFDIGAAD